MHQPSPPALRYGPSPAGRSANPRTQRSDWKWALLDLIAPPSCAGCGVTGSAWCLDCRAKTRPVPPGSCPACGDPRAARDCPTCAQARPAFAAARAFALYEPPFNQLLLRLKHHRDTGLGHLAAGLACERLRSFGWMVDLATSVPLGIRRRADRGYNQVDLWGRPLSRLAGLLFIPGALRRARETRSQVGLSFPERRENLRSAFHADRSVVQGKAVLILDDVFTTGATVNACSRALHDAGVGQVYVYTLARAAGGPASAEA